MSLHDTLEKILELLKKNPKAEHQSKLKTAIDKLHAVSKAFLEKLELASVENSLEYATLAGLLADPAKKKIVNLTWANDRLDKLGLGKLSGKSLTSATKNQFLLKIISAGGANDVIRELSQTEEDRLQNAFAKMARLSDRQVMDELDQNYKAAKLTSLCEANSISMVKKGAKVDRKATCLRVLEALTGFRERQKL